MADRLGVGKSWAVSYTDLRVTGPAAYQAALMMVQMVRGIAA